MGESYADLIFVFNDDWIRLNLTDILQGSSSGLEYGIVIYAETESVYFESTRQPNRPTLLVQPGK